MQCAVNRMKACSSQGQQPTVLPPTVRNLRHQQGLSALQTGPRIIGVGADLSLHCSTSSILTRVFIVLSRKRITPDSPLTGMGECVCVHSSQSKTMPSMCRAQNVYL